MKVANSFRLMNNTSKDTDEVKPEIREENSEDMISVKSLALRTTRHFPLLQVSLSL
jgi:hypothetical protein